jgi:hypothetical protein
MVSPLNRVLVWFSHGAASAVTLQQALLKYPKEVVVPVYCNTARDEHPDNLRFRGEVEKWLGVAILVIGSDSFSDCDDVFAKTKYMSGPRGARCTTELKKVPRFKFQDPYDTHCFGFTADKKELKRIASFEATNFDLKLVWLLRDAGITKHDCFSILQQAGIRLPEMYLLGYRNNNCIGCVKSSSPGYWAKIYRDFPTQSKISHLPAWVLADAITTGRKTRIFLDTLGALVEAGFEFAYKGENLSCGPECKG